VTSSLLADAFGHHVWATLRVIDACEALTPDQLETNLPGTFGSIIATLRHTVGADSWYLFRTSRGRVTPVEEDVEASMSLADLRAMMVSHGEVWPTVLAGDIDPDEMIASKRDDGTENFAPMGLRLAQALHHGTDHRSQICTALTSLRIEPPEIDLWDYGREVGRVTESPTPG
jgi:uncharacterized damage-inducible protein DinB